MIYCSGRIAYSFSTMEKEKSVLKSRFDIKDMGIIRWYLGLQMDEKSADISINQTPHIETTL